VTPATLTPGALIMSSGGLRYPAPVIDDGDTVACDPER
jgi:hypothetical protein